MKYLGLCFLKVLCRKEFDKTFNFSLKNKDLAFLKERIPLKERECSRYVMGMSLSYYHLWLKNNICKIDRVIALFSVFRVSCLCKLDFFCKGWPRWFFFQGDTYKESKGLDFKIQIGHHR